MARNYLFTRLPAGSKTKIFLWCFSNFSCESIVVLNTLTDLISTAFGDSYKGVYRSFNSEMNQLGLYILHLCTYWLLFMDFKAVSIVRTEGLSFNSHDHLVRMFKMILLRDT